MPTTHLRLCVGSSPDVLHRVVTVCRRRALKIQRLSYDGHEIALAVVGCEDRIRGVQRWLLALIDVLEVIDLSGSSPAADAAGSERQHRRPSALESG